MGQIDQNKDVARHFFEDLWSDEKLDSFDKYVHPSFYQHHARNRDEDLVKPSSLRNWLTALHDKLSQVEMRVELMFAEQDNVMLYLRGAAKYQADTRQPATGSPVRWTTTAMVRVVEGRIAESWVISDTLGVLQQIGVVRKLG